MTIALVLTVLSVLACVARRHRPARAPRPRPPPTSASPSPSRRCRSVGAGSVRCGSPARPCSSARMGARRPPWRRRSSCSSSAGPASPDSSRWDPHGDRCRIVVDVVRTERPWPDAGWPARFEWLHGLGAVRRRVARQCRRSPPSGRRRASSADSSANTANVEPTHPG